MGFSNCASGIGFDRCRFLIGSSTGRLSFGSPVEFSYPLRDTGDHRLQRRMGSQRHERRTQSRTCERKQGVGPASSLRTVIGDRLHHRGLPRDVRDLPRLLQRAQRRILRFSQRQHGRLHGCAKGGSRVVHQRGELRHLHHVRVGRVPGHRSFRLDVRCVSRGMEPTGRSRLPMLQSRRWSRALRAIATSGTRKRFGICTQARRWCPTCASRTA